MRNRRTGKNLPGCYVRENFYLCYEGSRLIGVFSLKFELTEFLLHYGGHIGYATRPSNRGRGLAAQMLKQGLELSRELGFDRIGGAVRAGPHNACIFILSVLYCFRKQVVAATC